MIGSRPAESGGLKLNRGFTWSKTGGIRNAHDNYYIPDEPGYYEAHWFDRPERAFKVTSAAGRSLGVMVCTDVMFNEWARHLGRQGALLIAVPRTADPKEMWPIAFQMAAVAAGAFVLSSNRVPAAGENELHGGPGMIVDPSGQILGATSADQPYITLDIDLTKASEAKSSHPRYVLE